MTQPTPPAPFGAPQAPDAIDRLMQRQATTSGPRKYHHFVVPDYAPLEEREVLVTGHGRCALVEVFLKILGFGEERDGYKKVAQLGGGDEIQGIVETIEALSFVKVAPVRPVEVPVVDDGGNLVYGADGQPVRETVDAPDLAQAFEFQVKTFDGSAEGFYAGLHPAMRKLVVVGYVAATSPDQRTAMGFIKSRRTVTR
jgi:hypothetical protein